MLKLIHFLFVFYSELITKTGAMYNYNNYYLYFFSRLVTTVNSICPGDICDAVYNNIGAVIRADDGDLYIPSSGAKCQTLNANCIGENCHACKCKSQQDTWNDKHQSCKNINSE